MQHLAFISRPVLNALMHGYKRVECRLSRNAHPAGSARPGDELLFKVVAGGVELYAMVEAVEHYDNLQDGDVQTLAEMYADVAFDIPGMDIGKYLASKRDARYVSFLWLTDLCALHISKERLPPSRTGWIADWPPA